MGAGERANNRNPSWRISREGGHGGALQAKSTEDVVRKSQKQRTVQDSCSEKEQWGSKTLGGRMDRFEGLRMLKPRHPLSNREPLIYFKVAV